MKRRIAGTSFDFGEEGVVVMLLDPNVHNHQLTKRLLSRYLHSRVVSADSIESADRQLYAWGNEIAAILVDISNMSPSSTFAFAKRTATKYNGPIIAFSRIESYNDELMKNGCTHRIRKQFGNEEQFVREISDILGLCPVATPAS